MPQPLLDDDAPTVPDIAPPPPDVLIDEDGADDAADMEDLLPSLPEDERATKAPKPDPWGSPEANGFTSAAQMVAVLSSDNPAAAARQFAAEQATAHAPADAPEQALEQQNRSLTEQADALVITDAATFERAGDLLSVLAEAESKVRAFMDDDIARAHAAWNGLTKKRKALLDPIEAARKSLGAKYAQFDRAEKLRAEQQRQADERAAQVAEEERLAAEAVQLEEAAAEAADPRQAERLAQEAASVRQEAASVPRPVLPVQRAVVPPRGISTKSKWTFEVTDKLALIKAVAAGTVSPEAVEVNGTYLGARARADKDTVTIPGVRIYDAGTTAVRRS